jgi:hypothetical protein
MVHKCFFKFKFEKNMKKILKILLVFVVIVVLIAVAGYIYLLKVYPKVAKAEDIKIEVTQARLERGKYLVNNVCACVDCHSNRDFSMFGAPLVEGTEGKGGFEFNEDFGLPGKFYARNITPASLGSWTDGEIIRAITQGVSRDGEPLFPLMAYPNYGSMDKEDIYSIITYLRTLKPIENVVPESRPSFPVNLIMRTIAGSNNFGKMPDKSNTVEYGKYLVNAANCSDCHTPSDNGKPIMDKYLSGGDGAVFPGNLIVRPANITPDIKTGIGSWSRQDFINKFRSYSKEKFVPVKLNQGDFNTYMPWTFYGNMTEEDLGAIYDYLRTIPAIEHSVTKFEKKLY